MRTLHKKLAITSVLILVLLPMLTFSVYGESIEGSKFNILIVNSYDSSNVWTKTEEQGIAEGLDPIKAKVEIFHEYMDSKRRTGDSYDQNFATYLKHKYKGTNIDLIVTTDDYATLFVKKFRIEIATETTPVVFSGVNDLSFKAPYFVGVYEKVDIDNTVALIKTIHGSETPIMIFTDRTISSNSIIKTSLGSPTWQESQNITLLQEDDIGVIRERISNLKKGAILFLLFNQDSKGNTYDYFEGLDEIKKSTDLPIYVVWDFYMGQQVMGGALITEKQMGEDVSRLITRIVNGEDYSMLSSITTKATNVLDYEMLMKYGIDDEAQEELSQIINQPESFWDEYSEIIILSLSLTAIFGLIVILLVNSIRQKNKYYGIVGEYKHEMIMANQKLEKRLSDSSALIEQLTEERAILIATMLNLKKRASFSDKFPTILHEISTQLSTVNSALSFLQIQNERIDRNELLLDQGVLLAEMRELVNETAVSTEVNIQHVINMISAIRTCTSDLNSVPSRNYKLHAYVDAFWTMIKPTIKKKKISLVMKIGEDVSLYGNPGDFVSILSILVGNSIRHGAVFSPEREMKIEIEAYSNGHVTQIIYRDDGNGCPTEKLENALNMKFDVGRIQYGGMGLFQLHQIITETLQGQITISGDVDEGMQARITLPRAGEHQ